MINGQVLSFIRRKRIFFPIVGFSIPFLYRQISDALYYYLFTICVKEKNKLRAETHPSVFWYVCLCRGEKAID